MIYIMTIIQMILSGNKNGRNAGAIIEYKHELYRVAQDCEAGYGENIQGTYT